VDEILPKEEEMIKSSLLFGNNTSTILKTNQFLIRLKKRILFKIYHFILLDQMIIRSSSIEMENIEIK
jgi:hypothetical protein